MNRIISSIVVLSLLCTLFITPISALGSETDIANSAFVETTLSLNEEFMAEAFNDSISQRTSVNEVQNIANKTFANKIEIILDTESETANIAGAFYANLSGCVEEVFCGNTVGYVGVYEGKLEDGTPVIADVVYTSDDVFVVLTLGTLGSEDFDIIFYGDFTDTLKSISNTHVAEIEANHENCVNFMGANVFPQSKAAFVEGAPTQCIDLWEQ